MGFSRLGFLSSSRKKTNYLQDKYISKRIWMQLTILYYNGKKNKNVYLMGTMHPKVITDDSHSKKLPKTIKFNNETKFGDYIMDHIARYRTCKTRTRCWPVACFLTCWTYVQSILGFCINILLIIL